MNTQTQANTEVKNTYAKYCPNVWVAKCREKHEKGEIIPVTTQYGKEDDSIVFNLVAQKDGFYYYSIVMLSMVSRILSALSRMWLRLIMVFAPFRVG